MSKFPPNKYQQDIIDWVKNGKGNAIVDAKAGSGKTSTLELIAQNYNRKMLFIAFNKHIADEINNKPELQDFVKKKTEGGKGTLKVYTVNALGDMTIRGNLSSRDLYKGGDNKFLKDNKLYTILNRQIKDICATRREQVTDDMVWDMMRDLRIACDKVRCKYVTSDRDKIQQVIDEDGLCQFWQIERDDGLSYPILPWAQIGEDALDESMALYEDKGIYDFVDQLYIPVVNHLSLPPWLAYYSEFIGCDESQDLNALQLRFLKKLINMKIPKGQPKLPTRFIFVSDAYQAIYGFAGADCHSVENIRRQFKTTELALNICYRCARKIVELAQEWVPTIEAAPNAKEGEIHTIDNSQIADYAEAGDMVIARKNKDLAKVFLSIILKGKPVYIKDKEMVDTTIKSIQSLGCSKVKGLKTKLEELHEEYRNQMRNPENQKRGSAINNGAMDIYDMIIAILDFFIDEKKHSPETPVEVFVEFIRELFVTEPSDDAIIVSSIHQVKGLEAKRVFIINYNLMPYTSKNKTSDENQQERNLIYIAITRAKEVLYCCKGEMNEDEKDYYTKMTSEEVDSATSTYEQDYYDVIFQDDE